MSLADTAVTTPADPCGGADCGIRDVLDRIGDRWSVLAVVVLSRGTCRFRELQRAIPGISQRMLTVTTRRLWRDGLVERTVYPTIPPRVDYELTDLGRGLAAAIFDLAKWSDANKSAIADARRTWDRQHGHPDTVVQAARPD